MKSIIGKLPWLLAAIGVIVSIGSLGAYLNFGSPNWKRLGVQPEVLKAAISEYPAQHCKSELTRPICDELARELSGFLGFRFDTKTHNPPKISVNVLLHVNVHMDGDDGLARTQ